MLFRHPVFLTHRSRRFAGVEQALGVDDANAAAGEDWRTGSPLRVNNDHAAIEGIPREPAFNDVMIGSPMTGRPSRG